MLSDILFLGELEGSQGGPFLGPIKRRFGEFTAPQLRPLRMIRSGLKKPSKGAVNDFVKNKT